ncbi:S1C family serine protease (plasmid) [Neorhizobium galegae]|nr:S1C family serine protease [Neorhizobium galegae]
MDIEKSLRSVVAVRASIPDNAFTANTLGTRREGSGVVIRENGLVLTIGYLITEAEDVWLTRQDGRVVPAHALAYDQESGFGLVQAMAPLDLPALQIGDSATATLGDQLSSPMARENMCAAISSPSRNSRGIGNICWMRRSSSHPPTPLGAGRR